MKPEAWRVDDIEVLIEGDQVERIDGVYCRLDAGGGLGGLFAIVDADPNDPERPPGRYWIMLCGRVFMSTDDKPSAFAAVEAIAGLADWDPLELEITPALAAAIEAAVAEIPVWMGPHPSAAMRARIEKRRRRTD